MPGAGRAAAAGRTRPPVIPPSALLLAALLVLVAPAALAGTSHADDLPTTITLSPRIMVRTKAAVLARDPALMPALNALVSQADAAMHGPAQAVVLKPGPPPEGDLHDYWSPDPDWPTASPCAETYDRLRLRRMSRDALTLALAWYLTGNADYAGKGTALIWSWCCDSQTRTRPDMAHAHARPGEPRGRASGIIETRDLIPVVEAARILALSPAWSPAVARATKAWFTSYLHWLRTSDFGREESGAPGCHGLWYDAQVAAFALFANDMDLVRVAVDSTRARLAEADGHGTPAPCPASLRAMLTLAAVAEQAGLDLWREPVLRHALEGIRSGAATACRAGCEPDCADLQYPPDDAPLFHRTAMVYKEPQGREISGTPSLDARVRLFY
jgi:hypothetical protein